MTTENVRDDQLPKGAGEMVPLPAASVILCRDAPVEILLVRRNAEGTFVPDVWLFPGGALDEADRRAAEQIGGDDLFQTALRVCAIREVVEESGVWLGDSAVDVERLRRSLENGSESIIEAASDFGGLLARLVLTAHWITPVGISRRYDTWFYLAAIPRSTDVVVDGQEIVEHLWITPQEALERHRDGKLPMLFPTLKNLETLVPFSEAETLLRSRREAEIRVVLPRLVRDAEGKRIVIDED